MRIRLLHRCPDCGKIIYLGVYDWAEYRCFSCGAILHVVPRGIPVNGMKALFNAGIAILLSLMLLFAWGLTRLGGVFPWLNAPVPLWGVIAILFVFLAGFILSLSAIMSTFSAVEHREKIRLEDMLAVGAAASGIIGLKPGKNFVLRFIVLSAVMAAFPAGVYLSAGHWGAAAWITAVVCAAVLLLPGRFLFRTIETDADGLKIKQLGFVAQHVKFQDIGRSFIVMKEEKDFPAYLYVTGKDGRSKLAVINLLPFKKEAVAHFLGVSGLKLDQRLSGDIGNL